MTKRMLIDTTHAEETRVVVLDGNRLDDYDVETSSKKQLKGNIYLAKIVRIEPSLQAAFVEYGGNRHGFLAFSEIHPDYYQIPVADRERLLALQEEEARAEEARADREDEEQEEAAQRPSGRSGRDANRDANRDARRGPARVAAHAGPDAGVDIGADTHPDVPATVDMLPDTAPADDLAADEPSDDRSFEGDRPGSIGAAEDHAENHGANHGAGADRADDHRPDDDRPVIEMPLEIEADTVVADADAATASEVDAEPFDEADESFDPPPETISGEAADDGQAQRRTARFLRQYKIQEVMRRRQVILVQVVKEERGNKGAALTTYISLAGRFSVLMPNSPRGGGVSRKITSAADRRRLKEITQELEIPRGMGMIVRTAGAQRPRAEIRRDGEYLLRTWDDIRETTLASTAPCLVYEEASLIKRAIRDVYTRDVEEIVVDGEAGWKSAREFMRTLMPNNAGKVGLWRDSGQSLFGHHGVEHHLDAMLQPTVQLRSGGYLVINQTEALVAIDVNSGRSTRERGIEETAFRTNMEAADEVARQLRLRDLAGLIVIDFIDMEVRRNNATVERRLKDALANDRARIQVGSISHFGLLEMSRQRLRPSIAESSFVPCAHCAGTGFMRGTESSALHVLRAIEEEAGKRKASEILVHAASTVALYVLNHKRTWLGEIESRHGLTVHLAADDSLLPPNLRIDRIRPYLAPTAPEAPAYAASQDTVQTTQRSAPTVTTVPIAATAPPAAATPFDDADEAENEPAIDATENRTAVGGETIQGESDENRRRKRRRRRRGGRRDNNGETGSENASEADAQGDTQSDVESGFAEDDVQDAEAPATEPRDAHEEQSIGDAPIAASEAAPRGRRRRGGRNRNRGNETGPAPDTGRAHDDTADEEPVRPAPRAYNGPTPADPFAGSFDIFEMIERDAEEMSAVMAPTAASAASHQPIEPPVESSVEPLAEAAAELAEPVEAEPVAEPVPEPVVVQTAGDGTDDPAIDAPQPEPAEAAAPVAVAKTRKPRPSRARKTAATPVADTEQAPAVADAAVEPVAGEASASSAVPVPDQAPAATKARRKPAARTRKTAVPAADTVVDAAVPEAATPEASTTPEAAAAEPVPADAPAEAARPVDAGLHKPQVIDDSAPPATRRTGWWKR